MKKIFLLFVVAIFLNSCGEAEPVADTELERLEQDAERAEKEGVYTALAFNDGIMAEITLLDVSYMALSDYDAIDTTEEAIYNLAKESVKEADKVIEGIKSINVIGNKGGKFQKAAVNLAMSFKKMAEAYGGLSDVFSIPDKDWTDEQFDRWDVYDLETVEPYLDAGEAFNELQLEYFSLNNLRTGNIVDPDAIYEESKTVEN